MSRRICYDFSVTLSTMPFGHSTSQMTWYLLLQDDTDGTYPIISHPTCLGTPRIRLPTIASNLSVINHSTACPYIHMDIRLSDSLIPDFAKLLYCEALSLTSSVQPLEHNPHCMVIQFSHFLYSSADAVIAVRASQFPVESVHKQIEVHIPVGFDPLLQIGFEQLFFLLADQMSHCIFSESRLAVHMCEPKKIKAVIATMTSSDFLQFFSLPCVAGTCRRYHVIWKL